MGPPDRSWFDKIQMYGIISVDRVAERARDSISKLLGFKPAREPRSFYLFEELLDVLEGNLSISLLVSQIDSPC